MKLFGNSRETEKLRRLENILDKPFISISVFPRHLPAQPDSTDVEKPEN